MYHLREVNRQDMNTINKWRNKKELIDTLCAPYRYINFEVDQAWFDDYMKSRNGTVRCAIVNDNDNNAILGLVSLTSINSINKTSSLHIMIGDKSNQEKGIGTFAVRELIKHAFSNLNLHRIELGVLNYNTRAIHLYEKIGFKKEGIKRQAVFKNGDYHDLIIMGLLKDEFNIYIL